MATRSYKCTNEECKEFELEVSVNESDANVKCPYCGSEVQRLFRPINAIWNCSGAHGKSNKN